MQGKKWPPPAVPGLSAPWSCLLAPEKSSCPNRESKKGSGKGNGKCTIARGWRGGRGNHQSAEQALSSKQVPSSQPTTQQSTSASPHPDIPRQPSLLDLQKRHQPQSQNQALPSLPAAHTPSSSSSTCWRPCLLLHGPMQKGNRAPTGCGPPTVPVDGNRCSVRHERAQPGPAPSVPNAPAAT